MSPTLIGIIGFAVLVLVFLSGIPIAFAMGIVGFGGICYLLSPEVGFTILGKEFWETFSTYALSVIPMFVFMGSIAFNSGISSRLYRTAYAFLGRLPAGLALATVAGCALFGAVCGSTTASSAAMGKVTLPEMKRYRYDPSLSTASVAAGGALAVLIPPSTGFIVYGILTQESIGKLFIAGIFPGILLSLLYMITIYILCRLNPKLAPDTFKTSWKDALASLSGSIDMLLLFALVMGGIFFGFFTATEAGAVGAGGALILSLIKRQLSWKGLRDSLLDTVAISSMIFVLLAGAFIFGRFIAYSRLTFGLIDWLGASALSPNIIIWLIIMGYMVGGCFMDTLPLATLTIPILYPVITSLGFDPIWFGVICIMTGEAGLITPPVGMNVFVLKGVAPDIPLETMFKGVWPFVIAILACIVIVMYLPQIALFLPNLMMG